MSCGVGRRYDLDPALLWLWRRPAATASVGPLAWKPQYAAGAALKRQKTKTYILYRLYSVKSYLKIMAVIPCAVQYVLVAYLFYTCWFVSVNPVLLFAPPSFPLPFGNP